MLISQLNSAAGSFSNIDGVTLHTDDPGFTGANDSGETKQALSWSSPSAGEMKATATFPDVVGTFTHVGLWDGDTFITSLVYNVTLPSEQDLIVLLELSAGVKS